MSDQRISDGVGSFAQRSLPYALGIAGLLPFWGLSLALVTRLPQAPPVAVTGSLLATYAATILAFLGGIRWGAVLHVPDVRRVASDYVFGVMPQLLGWGALWLSDPWRFAALGIGMLALGPIDRNLVARGLAPDWFDRLRIILSLGAGAALFLAALG